MSSTRTETYRTSSSRETKELGAEVARSLRGGPAVLALQGDLGAGKTTFVQGFLRGLGSKKRVTSPTFVLMRRHKLAARQAFTNVFHIDAYRLRKPEQLAALDLEVVLAEPKNIVLIEWPEQAKQYLPKKAIWVKFKYGKNENERTITVTRPASR